MEDFTLTPEQRRMIAEATPEQWAQALKEVVQDKHFWRDTAKAAFEGFIEGVRQALYAS